MTPAVSLGVVYSRVTGKIMRVINPTYEEELDQHRLSPHEFMLRPSKKEHGVSAKPDGMTLDDVSRIVSAMS